MLVDLFHEDLRADGRFGISVMPGAIQFDPDRTYRVYYNFGHRIEDCVGEITNVRRVEDHILGDSEIYNRPECAFLLKKSDDPTAEREINHDLYEYSLYCNELELETQVLEEGKPAVPVVIRCTLRGIAVVPTPGMPRVLV